MSDTDNAGNQAAIPDSGAMAGFLPKLLEAWNAHDIDRVAAYHAPDYVGENVAEASPQLGAEGLRRSLESYFTAFPDLRFSADDLIVQGNRIALAWTARGTHRGSVMNIPATHRPIAVRGVVFFTIERELIARALYVWDLAGLLRELGLLPDL